MKHPLTSKERRGLVAVAAAALLCIGSGFIFRSCGSRAPSFPQESEQPELSEQTDQSVKSDSSNGKIKQGEKRRKKEKKKAAKKKTEKTYPSRSPLDEPIEQ